MQAMKAKRVAIFFRFGWGTALGLALLRPLLSEAFRISPRTTPARLVPCSLACRLSHPTSSGSSEIWVRTTLHLTSPMSDGQSSVDTILSFLINLERCNNVQRALQDGIVGRRFFRSMSPALLRRFDRLNLRICSGQKGGFVHVRPSRLINKWAHSFFTAQLKNL